LRAQVAHAERQRCGGAALGGRDLGELAERFGLTAAGALFQLWIAEPRPEQGHDAAQGNEQRRERCQLARGVTAGAHCQAPY
jgi:hypothetical protein